MAKYDFLIVGSGLFGCAFAHLATKSGNRCLVIDKRPHVGGNLFCKEIEGIHVHMYGAHIFHTSNKEVWDFVNDIVPFNRYTNSPIANYKGELYNLPFNMNTFHQLWGVTTPDEAQAKIEEQRQEAKQAIGNSEPCNLEEQALLLVGRDIYEKLIRGYTEKQWGRKCSLLPPSIIKRLPVRMVYDNNYFNDSYQGIPIGGYNRLIDGLLANSDTCVNTDFFDRREELSALADRIVYTGPIDQFFNYCYGHLEYRSLRFETETLPTPNYQGNAVVNYTDAEVPYTRIIEHKHFESFGAAVYDNPHTFITREYPAEWRQGMEPFYPINDEKNNLLLSHYQSLAAKEENVIFGGRLAEYKYYDMAPVMERAMSVFNSL